MKRTLSILVVTVVAAAVFGVLVHGVLVATHMSQPAAATVHGMTTRRLWATAAALLGLLGVTLGGMAIYRAAHRIGNRGRGGASLALLSGLLASINGGLNLAVANGGPGTGNGVVGGAAAFVLGLIAMALGGFALARSRRAPSIQDA